MDNGRCSWSIEYKKNDNAQRAGKVEGEMDGTRDERAMRAAPSCIE